MANSERQESKVIAIFLFGKCEKKKRKNTLRRSLASAPIAAADKPGPFGDQQPQCPSVSSLVVHPHRMDSHSGSSLFSAL